MCSLGENTIDFVFLVLNSTNQVAALCESFSKSVLSHYRVLNNNKKAGIISKKSDISTCVTGHVVDAEKEK